MTERPKPSSWGEPFIQVNSLARFKCIGQERKHSKSTGPKKQAPTRGKSSKALIIPTKPPEKLAEIEPPRRGEGVSGSLMPPNYIRWLSKEHQSLERPSEERQNNEFLQRLIRRNQEIREAGFELGSLRSVLRKLSEVCLHFDGNIELDYSDTLYLEIKKMGLRLGRPALEQLTRRVYKFWRLRASTEYLLRCSDEPDTLDCSTDAQAFFPRERTTTCFGRGKQTRGSVIGLISKLKVFFLTALDRPEWNLPHMKRELMEVESSQRAFSNQLARLGFRAPQLSWLPDRSAKTAKIGRGSRQASLKRPRKGDNKQGSELNQLKQMKPQERATIMKKRRRQHDSNSSTHSAEQ